MYRKNLLLIFIGVLLSPQCTPVQAKPLGWNIFNLKHHWPLSLFHKQDTSFKYPEYVPGQVVQVVPKYPVWKVHKYSGIQLKPVSSLPALKITPPHTTAKKVFNNLPPIEEIQNILGSTSVVDTVETLKELASTEDGRNMMVNYMKASFPNLDISSEDITSAINFYEANITKPTIQVPTGRPVQLNVQPPSQLSTPVQSTPVNVVRQPIKEVVPNSNANIFVPYFMIHPSSNFKVAEINGQPYLWVPKEVSSQTNPPLNVKVPDTLPIPSQNVNTPNIGSLGTENLDTSPIVVLEENKYQNSLKASNFENNASIESVIGSQNNAPEKEQIKNPAEDTNSKDNIKVQKYEYPNFSYTQYSKVPTEAETPSVVSQQTSSASNVEKNVSSSDENIVPTIENFYVVPKLDPMTNFAGNVGTANLFMPGEHLSSVAIPIASNGIKFKQFEDKVITPLVESINTDKVIENAFVKPENDEQHNHASFVPIQNSNKYMFVVENTHVNHDNSNEIKVTRDKINHNGRVVNSLNYDYPNLSYTQLSDIPLEKDVIPKRLFTSYDVPITGQEPIDDIQAAESEHVIVTKVPAPKGIKIDRDSGESNKGDNSKSSESRSKSEHLQDTVVIYSVPYNPTAQE